MNRYRMNRGRLVSLTLVLLSIVGVGDTKAQYTRADSLYGALSPERLAFDVTFYHLNVRVDPEQRTVAGTNKMAFIVMQATQRIQIELFANMDIASIIDDNGRNLTFVREYNTVFIDFPQRLVPGTHQELTISYSGAPQVAKRPPWDGGLVWAKDAQGDPWVCVTSQGTGASLWWPNKDHPLDEPDSMRISITVPPGLMNISNGQFLGKTTLPDKWTTYNYAINYPINNYNVTLNIGKFAHFRDDYLSTSGDTLALDYYVMPENLELAKEQFAQTRPILASFESWFGPYPFPRDGFKLIESPHNGMEHQSAIAYGNGYANGYRGNASSAVGLAFDFIIVHEAAHEWWGNNIGHADIADMWIHESFGAYAEGLFVESQFGYEQAMTYLNGKRQDVRFNKPIVGVHGVHQPGSGDMYPKGALALNTLRHVIDDDQLWKDILQGLQTDFRLRQVSYNDVVNYISQRSGIDLGPFFEQYFKHTHLPTLQAFIEVKNNKLTLAYRWQADVVDFEMPVRVTTAPNVYSTLMATTKWQKVELNLPSAESFQVDTTHFYFKLQRKTFYRLDLLERLQRK